MGAGPVPGGHRGDSRRQLRRRISGAVSTAPSPTTPARCLPGVTVTATSPALIQPQVQVTGAEGDYRFIALPPGVYDVTFELSGFQTRQARRHSRHHQPDADRRSAAAGRDAAGNGHRHRRIAHRRHVDDAGRHELHEGTAHRDSERARHLGRDGAGARPADDVVRRRRLAHRHADRLPLLRLRRPEPDEARRHRHDRSHQRQRRLLRLRQLRRVPGRRLGQRRRQLRRRREPEHHRQVGRRSLHAATGTATTSATTRSATTCPTRSASPTSATKTASSAARRCSAATRSIISTTSTSTSAARSGRARRGSSTAIA